MIYLDNAATSHPKTSSVVEAVRDYMLNVGANPGRSGHVLSASAARTVFYSRQILAKLFGVSDSRHIVFTSNATESINIVLNGLLKSGDHVIATNMEHNAVMRPLRYLEKTRNIKLSIVDYKLIKKTLTRKTRLVVANHASNVTGDVIPVDEIKNEIGSIPILVDAAQTAGVLPINVHNQNIDFLAFTGHKALLGPQGTGGLYIRPGLEDLVSPLKSGGTGSSSEDEFQPDILPDKYESGTLNAAGIAGLGAGVKYILERCIEQIQNHGIELSMRFIEGVKKINGITLYGLINAHERVPVISINIKNIAQNEVGFVLDRRYKIMVRVGLHCAPVAHKTIGTFPEGTVRFSFGPFNTIEQIDQTLAAISEISKETGN